MVFAYSRLSKFLPNLYRLQKFKNAYPYSDRTTATHAHEGPKGRNKSPTIHQKGKTMHPDYGGLFH